MQHRLVTARAGWLLGQRAADWICLVSPLGQRPCPSQRVARLHLPLDPSGSHGLPADRERLTSLGHLEGSN